MRTCTKCHETKAESDFYYHASRGRYEARCKPCFRAIVKARSEANYTVVRAANNVAGAKFREANRERENARILAYHNAHRAERLTANRQWREANPDKHAAKESRRRASILRAVPAWANPEAIAAVYGRAREEGERTGEPMHVDHIVPLKSKYVCGLHCEANLQILPAGVNLSKGNRSWPDC